jgi:hypothetical protein
MTERLIDTCDCYDLESLLVHLQEFVQTAQREGHDAYTVHLDQGRIALIARTLEDGSEVLDLTFSEIPNKNYLK